MTKRIILFPALFAFGIAIVGTSLSTQAHEGATGIVKQRMDVMSMIGKSMKALAAMMRGKAESSPEMIRKHAAVIKKHAGEALLTLFPEGSTGMPSEANQMIWKDWQGFSDLANRLHETAYALDKAAGNTHGSMMGKGKMPMSRGGQMGMSSADLASMPPNAAFMQLSRTCAACHKVYRTKHN